MALQGSACLTPPEATEKRKRREYVSQNKFRKGFKTETRAYVCSLSRALKLDLVTKERFVNEVERLVTVCSKIGHEASLCANWLLRKHCEAPKSYPVELSQDFYAACINMVLGKTSGVKHKRNLQAKKLEIGPEDEKQSPARSQPSAKTLMYEWMSKEKWTSAFPDLEKELKGYAVQKDVIAKQMLTNCKTCLSENFQKRQMAVLRLTFPKALAERVCNVINAEDPEKLLNCEEFKKWDKQNKDKRMGDYKTVRELVNSHRSKLFKNLTQRYSNLAEVEADSLQLVRYYHWLGTLNKKERERRERLRKEREGKSDDTPRPKYRQRIFQLVPYHAYKRLSLHIQTKIFVTILAKARKRGTVPTQSKKRKLSEIKQKTPDDQSNKSAARSKSQERQLWLEAIETSCIHSVPPGFTFAFTLHTNGVQASLHFDRAIPAKPKPSGEEKERKEQEQPRKRKRALKTGKRKQPKRKRSESQNAEKQVLQLPQRGLFHAKRVTLSLPDQEDLKDEKIRVIGVDPGRDPLVAIVEGKQTRQMSAKEYRHWRRTGVRTKRLRWMERQARTQDPEIEEAFAEMSKQTFTTFSSQSFLQEWNSRRKLDPALWKFYAKKWHSKQQFESFQNKQRTLRSVAQRIVGIPTDPRCNGKKHAKSKQRDKEKETKAEIEARYQKILVAYGNAKFPTAAKGSKGSTPLLNIPRVLAGLRNCKACVVGTDEYKTSKLCNLCHQELYKIRCYRWNKKGKSGRYEWSKGVLWRYLACETQECNNARPNGPHVVLRTTKLRPVIDRNFNACDNISMLCLNWITTGKVPKGFQRTQIPEGECPSTKI